jgi:hypothetical protein
MSDKVIANIQNSIPILQQVSSNITTNPFIPNKQQIQEIIVNEISDISIETSEQEQRKRSSIQNISIKQIGQNISISIVEFIDELFIKPSDVSWTNYLISISTKKNRYTYFGILFIILGIIMWFLQKNKQMY